MKLTKEDYMRLPKERLAEMLAERDNEPKVEFIPNTNPYPYLPCTPWWRDVRWDVGETTNEFQANS